MTRRTCSRFADEQPELEAGYVRLHRGIGNAKAFRWGSFRTGTDPRLMCAWEKYTRLQFDLLSRSDLSFNSIHDRAKRVETGPINDDSRVTDQLAKERGLDIEHDPWTLALWNAAHQSFALRRWVSENKFGPHRIVCRSQGPPARQCFAVASVSLAAAASGASTNAFAAAMVFTSRRGRTPGRDSRGRGSRHR